MTRRYYCEYCDKTFIDEIQARKKHLQSANHIKLRNQHYDYNRDLRVVLKEESVKLPCRRFFQDGNCQFGSNCKYRHYADHELWHMKQIIEKAELDKKLAEKAIPEIPSLESWLQKYHKKHSDKNSNDYIFWTYPENLEKRTDLPPSLQKFKPEHFEFGTFDEWGK